jgi:hypothetical protein
MRRFRSRSRRPECRVPTRTGGRTHWVKRNYRAAPPSSSELCSAVDLTRPFSSSIARSLRTTARRPASACIRRTPRWLRNRAGVRVESRRHRMPLSRAQAPPGGSRPASASRRHFSDRHRNGPSGYWTESRRKPLAGSPRHRVEEDRPADEHCQCLDGYRDRNRIRDPDSRSDQYCSSRSSLHRRAPGANWQRCSRRARTKDEERKCEREADPECAEEEEEPQDASQPAGGDQRPSL